jgi:aminopeptidase N
MMIVERFRFLVLAAVTVLSAALALADSRPEHFARTHNYRVAHYKLNLNVDVKGRKLSGEADLKIVTLMPHVDTLRIDAADMKIESVTREGKTLDFSHVAETLFVFLNKHQDDDTVRLAIAYNLADPKKGMYFRSQDSGYTEKQWQLWTQGECEDNHFWFPCYDYPNERGTSEMIVTCDDNFTAISNGLLVDVQQHPAEHKVTYHWFQGETHVSYLISLIVGEYVNVQDKAGDVNISNYVYKFQKDLAMNSFGKTPKMIKFYEDKIGVKYPWDKFAQTVVQDFIFGGEENVTAVTLNDNTIHDARAHLDNNSDGLVAHELAHMWWGDMLTCRDWSNAWLNEGFATYFQNQFDGFDKGLDEQRRQMYETQAGLTADDFGDRRRATVSDRYNTPIELFGNRIYGKGACILTMLKDVLGEDAFWKSINHYATKFKYKIVETNDLKIAVEEATGQNLKWFFDEWVYNPGFPEFSVQQQWDPSAHKVNVDILQTQKVDTATGIFTMPVTIEVWYDDAPHAHRVWVGSAHDHFSFDAPSRPQMVLFDPESIILKKLTVDKSVDEWLYQLAHSRYAVDREIALEHLKSLEDSSSTVSGAIRDAMLHDSFGELRRNAASDLGSLKTPMYAEDILMACKDKEAHVRLAAVTALRAFPASISLPALTNAFHNDSSYAVTSAALTGLVKVDSVNAETYCEAALQVRSPRESIRRAALDALSRTGTATSIAAIKKFTDYGVDRELRITAMNLLVKCDSNKTEVLDLYVGFLHDKTSNVRRSAMELLGTLNDKRAIEPLEQTEKTEHDERLVQLAKDTVDRINGTK